MKDSLMFSTNIQFVDPNPIEGNPMISRVKIRIARPGRGNQYMFTREVLETAARNSLGLTPIVAYYNYYKEDFGAHGQQAVTDNKGEFITVGDTRAIGVVPENPEIYWDEEGFLVTFGYLWTTRYKEVSAALEGRSQSMELSRAHTIMQPLGDGRIEILETYFEGLCILGDDVTPAFEGAKVGSPLSFQYDEKAVEELDKGVSDFMADLKFALNSSEKADLVIDTDGEERDEKNRKKVSVAIDTLDDVAEESEQPDNVSRIDDAITVLVKAETDMKKEADVIPATEEAQQALQGTHDGKEGIVSTEELNYSSKKKNSLLQPKEGQEDDQLDKKKKKDSEVTPEEEENKEEQPEQLKPENEEKGLEVQQEEEIPEDQEAEEDVVEEKPTPSETDEGNGTPEEGSGESVEGSKKPEGLAGIQEEQDGVEKGGEPVQTGSQEETSAEIGNKRETAASKRVSAVLSELGDDEILEALTDRIQKTEEIKTRLTDILSSAIGNEAPQGGEVNIEGEVQLEDLGAGEEPGEQMPSGEEEAALPEDQEEQDIPPVDPKEDEKDSSEQEESSEKTPVEEGEKDNEEETSDEDKETSKDRKKETDEEKKKKKKLNFSLEEIDGNLVIDGLNFADIVKENQQLHKQNDELLEFKLNTEKDKKEKILNSFNLSDDKKDEIRLEFSKLSVDEVEEKAIIAEYKEERKARGQKEQEEKISFASVEEESQLFLKKDEDEFDILKKFLNKD